MLRTLEVGISQKLLEVLNVTRALTAQVDRDTLLLEIMDAATHLLEAERSTLFLIDYDRQELFSKIAQHSEVAEIRLPIGQGLAGHVASTGEVVAVEDAYNDPRFNSRFDTATGFRTRQVLAVPVVDSRQMRIGVIQVMNRAGAGFTAEDQLLLEALASSAAIALENVRLYARIDAMLQSFIKTLAASIDARDPQTAGHSLRVGGYAAQLARELGMSQGEQKLIYLAGLLHDYGKIGVPEAVLMKPSRLTHAEMQAIRQHPTMSRDILTQVDFTEELARIPAIVYQHHERIDGRGYPCGLRGDEISVEGRILAVCDVFDALTQRRYYHEAITHAEAYAFIDENRGTQFDSEMASAFGVTLKREGHVTEWHPAELVAAMAAAREAEALGRL